MESDERSMCRRSSFFCNISDPGRSDWISLGNLPAVVLLCCTFWSAMMQWCKFSQWSSNTAVRSLRTQDRCHHLMQTRRENSSINPTLNLCLVKERLRTLEIWKLSSNLQICKQQSVTYFHQWWLVSTPKDSELLLILPEVFVFISIV